MQLSDLWQRSLEFFERKNLALFSLVTLKTIKIVYGQFIKYFLVPFILFLAVEVICQKNLLSPAGRIRPEQILRYFFIVFFLIFVHLAVRSSILHKSWSYYKSYWKYGIYLMLWPLWSIFFVFAFLVGWTSHRWYLILLVLCCIALLTAFITFSIFFFLDSELGLKSFLKAHLNAAKMIIYNLPVCLLVTSTLTIIWTCLLLLSEKLYYAALADFGTIFLIVESFAYVLVVVCILSNLYIKFLHEQFDLYFDQPK